MVLSCSCINGPIGYYYTSWMISVIMKENTSLDPLGHIRLSVSDFEKSRKFYGRLFDFLGYQTITDESDSTGWVSGSGFGFWLKPAAAAGEYVFGSPGLHHFCFKAKSREQVDKLYNEFIIPNNIRVFDAPAAYPNYTDKYYAVYFADPDEIKLEYAYY